MKTMGNNDLISRKELMEGRVGNDPVRIAAMCAQTVDAVVLPCKIGDVVYMPTGRWRMTGFEPDVCDGFHIARDGVLQIKVKNNTGNHGTYGVPGKTAFLTREEAEAALAVGIPTNTKESCLNKER